MSQYVLKLSYQELTDLQDAVDFADAHLTLRRTIHRSLGLPTRVGAGPLQKRIRKLDVRTRATIEETR